MSNARLGALRVFSAARASRFTSGSGSRSGEESVRAESAYALSDSANARMTEPESARSSTRAIGSPCVATGAKTNRGPSGSADSGTSSWSLSA